MINDGTVLVITVDGVHAQIKEPRRNPNSNWQSHKNKKPGLSYELGILIHSPKLVWINGPFRAGEGDLTIFKKDGGLMQKLPPGKRAIGDHGYEGLPTHTSTRNKEFDDDEIKKYKRRALSRHESFNSCVKRFAVLAMTFRNYHDHQGLTENDRHKAVFEAVCVILQYEMENGNPLMDV
jgi:hypothetical protein